MVFILSPSLAQGDRWSGLAPPLASRELHDWWRLPCGWVRITAMILSKRAHMFSWQWSACLVNHSLELSVRQKLIHD